MFLVCKMKSNIVKKHVGVILIHGFQSSPKVFHTIKHRLKCIGVVVHTVKYNSDKGYDAWINSIDKELKEVNAEDVYVIGHSLGGSLALYLSKRYRFKGVITINSPIYVRKHFSLKLLARILSRFKRFKKITIRNVEYSLESVVSLFDFLNEFRITRINSLNSALIIQSKKDKVVNARSAKILYHNIDSDNKQLVKIGYGHTPLSQPDVIRSVIGFMGLV